MRFYFYLHTGRLLVTEIVAFVPPQQRFPAQIFYALLFYILQGTGVLTSALVDLQPTSAALNLSSRAFHTPPARNVHSHDAEDRTASDFFFSLFC